VYPRQRAERCAITAVQSLAYSEVALLLRKEAESNMRMLSSRIFRVPLIPCAISTSSGRDAFSSHTMLTHVPSAAGKDGTKF
jgi:hypothetical protein